MKLNVCFLFINNLYGAINGSNNMLLYLVFCLISTFSVSANYVRTGIQTISQLSNRSANGAKEHQFQCNYYNSNARDLFHIICETFSYELGSEIDLFIEVSKSTDSH